MPYTRGERLSCRARPRALGATPSLWSWLVLAALVSPANSFRRDTAIIHHSLAPVPCHTTYIPWILVTQEFVSHRSMLPGMDLCDANSCGLALLSSPGLALLCDKATSLQPGTDWLTHAKPKAHGLAHEGRARLGAALQRDTITASRLYRA